VTTSVVENVLVSILQQAHDASQALVPVGQALTGSLVALSILMLGASLASGHATFVAPIVRLCAAAAGTLWIIGQWPTITADTLGAAHRAIGLLIGGYDGPATLFQLAEDTSARIVAEANGASVWSPSGVVQAFFASIAAGALGAVGAARRPATLAAAEQESRYAG
jgi:hypothetical protein